MKKMRDIKIDIEKKEIIKKLEQICEFRGLISYDDKTLVIFRIEE